VARLGSRAATLERLAAGADIDVLVVGGGATGAGVVLESTLRGYRAALVDRADFASGTSRRSTKLVHGGLRYLLQGAFDFVRESLEERAFLLEHAADLVRPQPFLIPRQTTPDPPELVERVLASYDALSSSQTLPGHRTVDVDEFAARAPILTATDSASEYYEAQTDDARLVLSILAAAVERGALLANYLEVTQLESSENATRVTLRDTRVDGSTLSLDVHHVVVAVGAWLQQFCVTSGFSFAELCPGKGTHLVLEQPDGAPLTTGLVVRHPDDGRLVTLSPWNGHLLLGSTDAECDPSQLAELYPEPAEIEYLIEALRALAPDWTPHVTAAWSGVRPLLGHHGSQTGDLSREDHLIDLAPAITAIVGGKLTTFHRLAQRTVDRVEDSAGWPRRAPASFPRLQEPLNAAEPQPNRAPLVHSLPFRLAHLRCLAQSEMVVTLDDVLTQRLPISLLRPDEAHHLAPDAAHEIAPVLGWDEPEWARQVSAYRSGLDRFRDPRPSTA
jgi:glycerol-3-phosphate dehydrogenase